MSTIARTACCLLATMFEFVLYHVDHLLRVLQICSCCKRQADMLLVGVCSMLPFCLRICCFFIIAVSECESSIKLQFSADKVEGQGRCQPFLRQAMLSQTANCELFNVGRRVCREVS